MGTGRADGPRQRSGRLRPTRHEPSRRERSYRRPGGPWDGDPLDRLLSGRGGGLVDGDLRLSSAAMESLVARTAGGLAAHGVRSHDVVSWRLPNSFAAVVLARACWRIGAVAAPVLHALGDADAEAATEQVAPRLLLDPPETALADPEAFVRWCGGDAVPIGAGGARPADVALVLFTSGSTGRPKAVLHTHRALSWKARLMGSVHGLGPADTVLMPAPLAHISGTLNGVLLPGATGMDSVLMRRFDPATALDLVEEHRVSFMAGPPTFFVAMATLLAERADGPPGSARLISSGGAAVTPAFVDRASAAFGCRVKRTYGSTEAPTVTTSTDADSALEARETDGRAVGEVELRVVDPATGRVQDPGHPGELWVRGPELFAGYADPHHTASVSAPGGWFRTGDQATVDDEGWLRIVGRLRDTIIRGGENISASEVEAVLEAHRSIRQAVAVGYPDPLMGERVAAFVVSDGPFDVASCRSWFAERRVARFKTPERVTRLERLPLLASGKPDRSALAARAAAAAD